MKTRIQKWGNSLALRIPKAFASEVGLEPDSEVDVTLVDGQIVIAPTAHTYTLDELLDGITKDNLHGEVNTGAPMGNESW
jgi:antitoxin MazE